MYWICRAKGDAVSKYDESLDIGAVVPVESYLVGLRSSGTNQRIFKRSKEK